MSLFAEMKRRNVVRVGAAYAVVAWLLIEVSDTILPRLGLPDWTVTFVIVLVALGFPLALFLSWAYELTPEGVKRTHEVPVERSVTGFTGRRLDFAIIGVLALALAWFSWDRFGPHGVREASIAVLPFVDMSADGDQAYFGDGLSEEILNLLAGIRELKVSGRTSSFAFRGTTVSIPEIGRELGVAHVLEGSVRRSGDRLRITAQLVETATGFHLWSETYDRRLEDVFAIQDEIAGHIANALRLTLAGSTRDGTSDLEAYDLYLRARTLIYGRTPAGLVEARRLIDRSLALDPDYPPALAASGELLMLLSDSPNSYGDIPEREANAAARIALERALGLDPNLADANAAMGLLFINLKDYAGAEAHLERALALNPSHTNANHWYALSFLRSGRLNAAIEARRRFERLDPLFLTNLSNLVWELAAVGNFEESESLARRLRQMHPQHNQSLYGLVPFVQGRLAEAAEFYAALNATTRATVGSRVYAAMSWYGLGEYDRVLDLAGESPDLRTLSALGREAEGLAAARAQFAEAPGDPSSRSSLLWGLSAAGRHEELLDWVSATWSRPEDLERDLRGSSPDLGPLVPLAVAQRATGRDAELAVTLEYMRGFLDFLEENGWAFGRFVADQARFHALSGERTPALDRLAEAIDLGHRDPLMGREPAFEPWWNDAAFQALVARNLQFINVEREKLGLARLGEQG
ncbi:hypothetical protein BH23GEM9_BH23GEM9_07360 [soil metagenome]